MEDEISELKAKIQILQDENRKMKMDLNIDQNHQKHEKEEKIGRHLNRKYVKDVLEEGDNFAKKIVLVAGWARSIRKLKTCAFIEFYDGSTQNHLQIVIDEACAGYKDVIGIDSGMGASFVIEGEIVARKIVDRKGSQPVEMKAQRVELIGKCQQSEYPIAKTPKEGNKIPIERLRENPHLRPRTLVVSSIMRIRNACSVATHLYFQSNGFLEVHAPIITSCNADGNGETLQVTTLLRKRDKEANQIAMSSYVPPVHNPMTNMQNQYQNSIQPVNQNQNQNRPDQKMDYSQDFFGKSSFLTTSGQIHLEMYSMAMGKVYSFGPTFSAEISNTKRHTAEHWMVEPEIAFADLEEAMDVAESYIKYVIRYVIQNCQEELSFLEQNVEQGIFERLEEFESTDFKRISYTDVMDLLRKSKKKFKDPAEWGEEISNEHEKYLTEVAFKQPVFVYDYPKETKPFHARLNEDGTTVKAMDLFVSRIGELVGGSQREERKNELEERMRESELDAKHYEKYLELRDYGTCVHSGFGVGFDRLVMLITGVDNIRDVIPFYRTNKSADC